MIKADGLAAGKGVIIAEDAHAAREALEQLLVERRFGTERVVVEEYLEGEEVLAAGGVRRADRGSAGLGAGLQADLRRRPGPNTGGMGSFSPVPAIDQARARARSARACTSRCWRSWRGAGSLSTACSTPA